MKGLVVVKTYNDYESHIVDLFNNCEKISWKGRSFNKVSACKPRAQGGGGEPKTDVYVLLENTLSSFTDTIKISVKQDNAEFLANKLTATVAEELFGCDWKNIIIQSISPIRNRFEAQKIVYLKPKNSDNQDAFFTLGWKLEITNKPRKLSSPLSLNKQEIVRIVYKGTNQPDRMRNAIVFGSIEEDSGIAEYLLEGNINSHPTVDSILSDLQLLDTYVPGTIHLAFTANNYRFKADKADGARTLAIAIEWAVEGRRLKPTFNFNEPLRFQGETDMMPIVKSCLTQLDIESFDDIQINEIKPI